MFTYPIFFFPVWISIPFDLPVMCAYANRLLAHLYKAFSRSHHFLLFQSVFVFFVLFFTLCCPKESHLQQSRSRATQPFTNYSACWVFICFHNPPNSDMDYRIFNVRTCLFLCVRAHVHTGVGHTDCETAQRFWLTILCVCSWRMRGANPTLYQLSHPVSPILLQYVTHCHHANLTSILSLLRHLHSKKVGYIKCMFKLIFEPLCLKALSAIGTLISSFAYLNQACTFRDTSFLVRWSIYRIVKWRTSLPAVRVGPIAT